MKTINKYVDEISGREFAKREDAIKSEKKNGGIKKLFAFWKKPKDDGTCRFANGEWCYQRLESDYIKLIEAIIKAVVDYEPYVAKQYEKSGGLRKEHVNVSYMLGRILGGSELYSQLLIMSNVCKTCFREWGQPYHSNNCTHSAKPKAL